MESEKKRKKKVRFQSNPFARINSAFFYDGCPDTLMRSLLRMRDFVPADGYRLIEKYLLIITVYNRYTGCFVMLTTYTTL